MMLELLYQNHQSSCTKHIEFLGSCRKAEYIHSKWPHMVYSSYNHEGSYTQIDDSATENRIVSMCAMELGSAQWQQKLVDESWVAHEVRRTKYQRNPWLVTDWRRLIESNSSIGFELEMFSKWWMKRAKLCWELSNLNKFVLVPEAYVGSTDQINLVNASRFGSCVWQRQLVKLLQLQLCKLLPPNQ